MIYDVNGNAIIEDVTNIVTPTFSASLNGNALIKHAICSHADFVTAYNDGYKMMEGDVHFTSDGYMIVNHDSTLGGLTIASSTLAELQAVATVYLFDDFMLDCKKYNVFADIDFTKTYTQQQSATLVDHIIKAGMNDRCSIECYVSSSAVYLTNASTDLILNILGIRTTANADSCEPFEELSKCIIATIPHSDITTEIVQYCHQKGYITKTWTGAAAGSGVDTKAQVEGYLDMGISQVITNSVKPSDIVPT